MSDQLTAPAQPGGKADTRAAVLQVVLAVALLAALGALAGVVWNWAWTAPVGVVSDHQFLAENEASLRGQFTSTGWFVVIASVTGLLGGALVALLLDRVPLLTLAAVIVGSAVATWLMLQVGAALGPADPHVLAKTAKEGTHLSSNLTVSSAASGDLPRGLGFLRHSPLIALPAGALVGLTLVFFGLSARERIIPARTIDPPPAG